MPDCAPAKKSPVPFFAAAWHVGAVPNVSSSVPTAADRRRSARRLWLLNVLLACLVGSAWLSHLPERASAVSLVFAPVALVSTLSLVSLAPGLALQLAAGIPWLRAAAALQGLAWSLFQLLVFADTRVYGMFRIHLNGMVWSLMTTPGTEDSVAIGRSTWLTLGLCVALVALAQAALFVRWSRPPAAPQRAPWWRRRAVLAALLLGAVVVADKSVFAWSDLRGHRGIQSVSSLFPAYARLTVRRFARTQLGQSIAHGGLEGTEGGLLRYPLEPIALPAEGPRPNVVMIVVDSLRHDMLAPATMPFTSRLAETSRRFDDHLATGNGTRYGVFGMLYGLHGSYWKPMLDERRSPVLLDALEAAGYELRAFSSTSLGSPELRSTCFAGLCRKGSTAKPGLASTMESDEDFERHDERIEDALLHHSPHGRDTLTAERAAAWIGERANDEPRRPFFAFVFFDAPHQVYAYPPEHEVFTPAAEEIDYLALSSRLDPETTRLLFNRYKNAVHYADAMVARVVEGLDAAGLADSTWVMVTGDHGEEFGENGFWGHVSNFCAEQVKVPFVLRGPGIEPGVETRPTSHADIPATILEHAGLDPSLRARWTMGMNLLSPPESRRRVLAGWDRLAVWVPEGILTIPLAGIRGTVEVRDMKWQELADDEQDRAIAAHADLLVEIARDCGRFLH